MTEYLCDYVRVGEVDPKTLTENDAINFMGQCRNVFANMIRYARCNGYCPDFLQQDCSESLMTNQEFLDFVHLVAENVYKDITPDEFQDNISDFVIKFLFCAAICDVSIKHSDLISRVGVLWLFHKHFPDSTTIPTQVPQLLDFVLQKELTINDMILLLNYSKFYRLTIVYTNPYRKSDPSWAPTKLTKIDTFVEKLKPPITKVDIPLTNFREKLESELDKASHIIATPFDVTDIDTLTTTMERMKTMSLLLPENQKQYIKIFDLCNAMYVMLGNSSFVPSPLWNRK